MTGQTAEDMRARGFTDAQADGTACVFCGVDFTLWPSNGDAGTAVASQPVDTLPEGGQVFACVAECGNYEEWLQRDTNGVGVCDVSPFER